MVWVYDPPAPLFAPAAARRLSPVALWLWGLAALVFLMVLLGGATRLMEAGLSITEWKPLTGAIPPLTQERWLAEFENYKKIPQYAQIFPDMDLAGFKTIYFFEWAHRLLGRLIGLALVLPMAAFWLRGDLSAKLKPQLLGLLALGGLQGFVGWWMVKSGLTLRTEVAQERLAIHLLLACASFVWILWLASGETRRFRPALAPRSRRALLIFSGALLALAFVQIGFGALVAGLRAGRVYMTWPLIEGRFIPPAEDIWRLAPFWANHLDNALAVQLQHRLLGYALGCLALAQAFYAYVNLGDDPATRRALLLALLVLAQIGAGVTTLLLAVPLWAGLMHQALALITLAAAALNFEAIYARKSRIQPSPSRT